MIVPKYLYKVLSNTDWQATPDRKVIILPKEDDAFIHFSTEDQLERMIIKYFKYVHLYDGLIPYDAIIESRVVVSKTVN